MKLDLLKSTLAFFCATCLAACANDSGNGATPAGNLPPAQGRDVTNRSQCKGLPNGNPSIFVTGWETNELLPDQTELTTKMYFYQDTISLFSFCQKKGVSTYATITVNASIGNNTFQVLSRDSKVATAKKKDIEVRCEASLAQGIFTYSFVGPCLQVQDASGTRLFNPR